MAGKRTLPSSIESQEGKTNQAKQQAASLPSANPNIDKAEEQLEKGLSSYATQQERLHASTVSGGLKAIPQQFYDPNGDWQLTFDPNYFKRLYLDHTEYKIITNELLEKNYRVILSFWDGIKWQYEHSGNTDQLIRIFEKTSFIESSHHHLKEAYDRIKKAGVDTYYYQIEQQRKERGKRLLEPHLTDLEKTLNATRVLLSSNENFIKNFARLSTPLTEEEVTEELELLLQKTNSERRQDGFSKEHEYFLFDIREKLRDLVLQNEEEEELISHAQNKYKITSFPEIEQLIRKALYETRGSERVKTKQEDIRRFSEYYYYLLKKYGLEAGDELPEQAKTELLEQDSSRETFFPLKDITRNDIIHSTIKRYKKDLSAEKEKFREESHTALSQISGYENRKRKLETDSSYLLLLPAMRDSIIQEVISEIKQKQENDFIESVRKLYQVRHWKVQEEEAEDFIDAPEHYNFAKEYHFDWLTTNIKNDLFEKVKKWAAEEYQKEQNTFKSFIGSELKKDMFQYGFPVDVQQNIEKDTRYQLHEKERRSIITFAEELPRQKAKKEFITLVKEHIKNGTLVPEVERELLSQGKKKYHLSNDKNSISISVETAEEIIAAYRRPFNTVIEERVKMFVQEKALSEQLRKKYNISHLASIAKHDVDKYLDSFHCTDDQKHSMFVVFCTYAAKENLYIIERDAYNDFKVSLDSLVVEKSHRYRYSLKKWFHPELKADIKKIAAAYGVSDEQTNAELELIENEYKAWTRPDFLVLGFWVVGIIGGLMLLRGLISISGYGEWIFYSGPIQLYPTMSFINFDEALNKSSSGFWVVGVILIIVFFALYLGRKER